jgi:hypothetical protein
MVSQWKLWALLLWALWGLGLIGYELWCVITQDPETPPLTFVLVQYVPSWVLLPFLCWLLVHFASYYVVQIVKKV